MRAFAKKLIGAVARNDFVWSALSHSVVPALNYAKWVRRHGDRPNLFPEATTKHFPDFTVRHGPFTGLKMLPPKTYGDAIFPMLLGCFEREIHPFIDAIIEGQYSEIVNVGCAGGYYAVGFAKAAPTATIYAFDIDSRALGLCKQLAALNGLSHRLVFGERCDSATICKMQFSRRALILCDCEGFESTLFTDDVVTKALRFHDALIEVHDNVDVTISRTLRERFAKTHDLQVAESVDDVRKPYLYDYPELAEYSLAERQLLMSECRISAMQWFYFTAKERKPS